MEQEFIKLLIKTKEYKTEYKIYLKELISLRKIYFKNKFVKPIMTLCVARFHPFGEKWPGTLYNPEHSDNRQDYYIHNKVIDSLHKANFFEYTPIEAIFRINMQNYLFHGKKKKFVKI